MTQGVLSGLKYLSKLKLTLQPTLKDESSRQSIEKSRSRGGVGEKVWMVHLEACSRPLSACTKITLPGLPSNFCFSCPDIMGLWLYSPCHLIFRFDLSLSPKHWSLSLVTLSVRLVTVNVSPDSVTFNLLLSVSMRKPEINFCSRSSIWHRAHVLLQNFDVDITFWFICMSKFTDATNLSPRFTWRQRK